MSSDTNNIQLIAGLGNPGNEYEKTRHNVGFWFIDRLVSQYNLTLKNESKFLGEVAKFNSPSGNVWLLKPNTFMNRSGQSIARLAQFYKIKPEQILIVHDELDLPPGNVKLKQGGGHGGHNGLRDSINQLGKNFYRLYRRCGSRIYGWGPNCKGKRRRKAASYDPMLSNRWY